jgi:hypothetical protein
VPEWLVGWAAIRLLRTTLVHYRQFAVADELVHLPRLGPDQGLGRSSRTRMAAQLFGRAAAEVVWRFLTEFQLPA